MEVLKIHPWNSRDNHIEKFNYLIFDLNPHPKVNWKSIIKCKKKFKEVLNFLSLKSFVKTSSGKGLDLYVLIPPHSNCNKFYYFAHQLAKLILKINPRLYYTAELIKYRRINKIFIDYI